MTHSSSRWIRRLTPFVVLSVCAALVACSSTKAPSSTRDLEVQATGATSRTENARNAAKVEPTRDGRVAPTDGWGRPILPPPNLLAPQPAAAAVIAPPTRAVAPSTPATAPETTIRPIGPSPAPTASAATPAPNTEAALRKMLDEWRGAWARGDADAYLKFYDVQFKGAAPSRAAWESQRRQRLANRNIDLHLTDVRVVRSTAEEAELQFMQQYRSANHTDSGVKNVKLRRFGAEWKIVSEAWIDEKSQPRPLR